MLRYLGLGERRLGDCPMPAHARVNWEFLAVVKGELAPFRDDREDVELRSDTLWLLPPGYVHGWRGKIGQKCEIVVLHFSGVPSALERLVNESGYVSSPLTIKDRRVVQRLAKSLKPHYWKPTALSEIYSERALLDLSLLLLRGRKEAQESSLGGSSWSKVADAESWLRQHIRHTPTVADAARAVGISPSQLRRLFWKVRRKNPKHLFDKIRFEKAMHLMAETDAKLERVAADSGFSNATNFCRAFKAFVGKSPTTWRKEIYIQYKKPRQTEQSAYDRHGRRYREL